jgi:glutamine amidotransferase
MARLIGLFGNRSDLIGRVVQHEARVLDVRGRSGRPSLGGWGVGFHQGGEVLIRKRPVEERAHLSIAELVHDVRADSVMVHVRAPSDEPRAEGSRAEGAENTHPFRYRNWLFAQTGALPGFARARPRLLESVPDFLSSQIRGETDAEVLFTVFLSFLHDSGGLELDSATGDGAVRALRSTLALADAVGAEFGQPAARINLLLSNGELMLGVHRGRAMAFREYANRADIAALSTDENDAARRPDLGNMHLVVVASDFHVTSPSDSSEFEAVDADALAGWQSVEPGSLVTLRRGAAPQVEPL